MDVKLFSGLECRERYPTIFRHGPILGTFREPRGTWNLETIRVWYLIWSIFWDKCPKFSDLQFLGTIYLLSISEWNETNLPGLLLQTGAWIQTEFGTFFDKNAQKLDFRLGHLEILVIYIKCTRSPPVRTRSWLNSGCEDLLFQIYYKLVVPMNFEWMHEGQAKPSWITEGFTLLLIPNIQWKYCMLERIWSYSFDDANRTFSMFLSMAKLGLGS